MAKIITISARMSISDLSEKWCAGDEEEVVFEISQESSFMPFVEGIALGYLRDFILAGKKISTHFHRNCKKIPSHKLDDALPKSLGDLVKSNADGGLDLRIPELLCGIFGLNLLCHSDGLHNAIDSSDGPSDAKKRIGRIIWKTVKRNKGLLGDGKNQYLIAWHSHKIPEILRQNTKEFSSFEFFRKKMFQIMNSIIHTNKHNQTEYEQNLLSLWVYNMAENSYDHGCRDFQKKNQDTINQDTIKSFNGILIQKIAAQNRNEVIKQKGLDEKIKTIYSRSL